MNGIQLDNFTPSVRVKRDTLGLITEGLQVGDVLHQNQAIILTLRPGELKGDPEVGVGIADALLDHDLSLWRNRVRSQLERDGQTVERVNITPDGVAVEAHY